MKKYFILLFLPLVSCKKFLELDPPNNQVTTDRVFQSDETAIASVSGIYSEMMATPELFANSGVTFYTGLYADELQYYSPSDRDQFTNNAITEGAHSGIDNNFWSGTYKFIYAVNLVLEKLEHSTGVTTLVRDRLVAECKFVRAFCYFYLVNLFGDVPLVASSDYEVNAKMPRTPVSTIYQFMKKDLSESAAVLPSTFVNNERVRPTKFAALALLARVQLYLGEWTQADEISSQVIASTSFSLVMNPANVFLKNSTEAIWQLLPVSSNVNTYEGSIILPATATTAPTYIFPLALVNSLEGTDKRKAWFTSRVYLSQIIYYPTKYLVKQNAIVTEYYMVLRLAEQFLIRSEARAQLDRLSDAFSDLNVIRSRAGLTALSSLNKIDLLLAIEKERRIEFAAEWGHRWFDLKRTGRAAAVLAPIKSGWQNTDVLWPIPYQQLRLNSFLNQNDGY
ncbi:MAG: RagB/SusD family nutrient uptake outer membrane protein [Chitinophagaceae bacterium]